MTNMIHIMIEEKIPSLYYTETAASPTPSPTPTTATATATATASPAFTKLGAIDGDDWTGTIEEV